MGTGTGNLEPEVKVRVEGEGNLKWVPHSHILTNQRLALGSTSRTTALEPPGTPYLREQGKERPFMRRDCPTSFVLLIL